MIFVTLFYSQMWAFWLLEALDLETLLLRSEKNIEITSRKTTTDIAQTATIHIFDDLASLLDLCTCDTVSAALSTACCLVKSMDSAFRSTVVTDDRCVTLSNLLEVGTSSIFLEMPPMAVLSRGQFRCLWCKYRALFKDLPHSMLRRSLSRAF